jgi:rubredoxin
MIIEINDDKVLWSHGTNLTVDESWSRADIEELIWTYESQKHGQWVWFPEIGAYSCSICHKYSYRDITESFNYCPHCGAKMDGARNR